VSAAIATIALPSATESAASPRFNHFARSSSSLRSLTRSLHHRAGLASTNTTLPRAARTRQVPKRRHEPASICGASSLENAPAAALLGIADRAIFGMLPLVVIPRARRRDLPNLPCLGAVIVGVCLISHIFTLM